MSQTTVGAGIAAEMERLRLGSAKRRRLWQLLYELARVLVQKDDEIPTPTEQDSNTSSSPKREFARRRPKAFDLPRKRNADTAIPAVWHDVQVRALEARMRPYRPRRNEPVAARPCELALAPTQTAEGELDWRPFLLARMQSDFAAPSPQATTG